jgi:hypothetical protein
VPAEIPSVWVVMPPSELPPHHNVRTQIDLLGSPFARFPTELTAVVLLESGRHVSSEPYHPTRVIVRLTIRRMASSHALFAMRGCAGDRSLTPSRRPLASRPDAESGPPDSWPAVCPSATPRMRPGCRSRTSPPSSEVSTR